MCAPYGEDLWGALASKGGVIVTVEKIVPTEFIKKYAALVKIPSYAVKAVALAPLGLHPFSFANPGISDIEPYEKDVDFLDILYEASASEHALDEWIKEWILHCEDHEQYLAKLGDSRIAELKERAARVRGESAPPPPFQDEDAAFEPKEMMLIALAREILSSVKTRGHKMVLAGAGVAATAAFLAYYQLKSDGFELGTGNGQVGYAPVPGEPILASEAGCPKVQTADGYDPDAGRLRRRRK